MGGGILGGWWNFRWVKNIKLGGEMCGGHRWVMDICGWYIKLGGEYKAGWRI